MGALLCMCVQGSFLIIGIVAVRAVLGRWLSRTAVTLGWWVAAMRLMLPVPFGCAVVSMDASASGHGVAESGPGSFSLIGLAPSESLDASLPMGVGAGEVLVGIDAIGMVWAIGSLALMATFACLYVIGRRRLARSVLTCDARLMAWLQDQRIVRRLTIRESCEIASPLTTGVIHPVIFVPTGLASGLSHEQLALVLAHELSHIRRADVVLKALTVFVACLYWFNPFVWVMYVLARRDMELASDEYALRGESRRARALYARTLVDLCSVDSGSWRFRLGVPAALHLTGSSMELRVASVLRGRVSRIVMGVACAVLATVGSVSLALASSVAPVSPIPSSVIVGTPYYSFEIPEEWHDKVSVRSEGNVLYVYMTKYPEVWLASFALVPEMAVHDPGTAGCRLIYAAPVGDGLYLEVRAINYVGLSVGDSWRTALAANPVYPGEEGEACAIALSTGGAFEVEDARNLTEVSGEDYGGFDYYRAVLVPTIRIGK